MVEKIAALQRDSMHSAIWDVANKFWFVTALSVQLPVQKGSIKFFFGLKIMSSATSIYAESTIFLGIIFSVLVF